mmetsp:Transcript_1505/g.3192  ORF Transcript_1505/g.3192 Transcript_1505/m.3192 type:complete len:401 (+) Transcript_1505:207-1409(+)|eukprot:CAMPEP_0172313104 /NCGR_PEP_ID=MMETSP1058-20130122/19427_1 /TAXON_ID=83371 /ORGANISM="Detonula confervacea, Strain CCMP 353" /LENGTH=400 /DNA_ID=CAMNT_0013026705 /DNA_START=91 /DNA_END=1293 /DNA_ORIENTATION=+
MVKVLATVAAIAAVASNFLPCSAFKGAPPLGTNRQVASVLSQSNPKVALTVADMPTRPMDAGAFVRIGDPAMAGPDTVSAAATEGDELPSTSIDGVEKIGEFSPLQTAIRASVPLVAVLNLVDPQPLDDLTESVWSAIYNWGPTHAPLFEADVASFGFVASIVFFSGLHLVLGPERTRASRLDGKLPTKPFEWAEMQNFHLWFNPLASYLGSIWIYHQFLHEKAPLPELAPTFGFFVGDLLFGIFLYDLCFFPIHYLMHKSSWGPLRKVHGYHHRSSNTLNSVETVQHSYTDGFLQVAVNILVQQISLFGGFGHKHAMSRLFHNIFVTYLLSEAHSGYDMGWMSHRLFPEILGGAPRHEQHHHDGRVYYQQYFKYLDDFFGFTNDKEKGEKAPQLPQNSE